MFSIEIKESANHDVVEAFLYYENVSIGLGERFFACLESKLNSLKNDAALYQKKYKNFRQTSLKPFPYHIIYEIENSVVVVYKVIYQGRDYQKKYTKK